MFETYLRDGNAASVARELNRRRVNPPAVYTKTKEVYCIPGQEQKLWHWHTVMSCLKNEVYIGTMVVERTVGDNPDEWVRIEDNHEAIVDKDVFVKAQEIIAKSRRGADETGQVRVSAYTGYLHCGLCGAKFNRNTSSAKNADGSIRRYVRYCCPRTRDVGLPDKCENRPINIVDLDDLVITAIKKEFAVFLTKPEEYMAMDGEHGVATRKEHEHSIRQTNNNINRFRAIESNLYIDYRENRIDVDEYISRKEDCRLRKVEFEHMLTEMKNRLDDFEKLMVRRNRVIKGLIKLRKPCTPDRELIESFIEKIIVWPGKRVEIDYSCGMEDLP
jgi:hypothetical protein